MLLPAVREGGQRHREKKVDSTDHLACGWPADRWREEQQTFPAERDRAEEEVQLWKMGRVDWENPSQILRRYHHTDQRGHWVVVWGVHEQSLPHDNSEDTQADRWDIGWRDEQGTRLDWSFAVACNTGHAGAVSVSFNSSWRAIRRKRWSTTRLEQDVAQSCAIGGWWDLRSLQEENQGRETEDHTRDKRNKIDSSTGTHCLCHVRGGSEGWGAWTTRRRRIEREGLDDHHSCDGRGYNHGDLHSKEDVEVSNGFLQEHQGGCWEGCRDWRSEESGREADEGTKGAWQGGWRAELHWWWEDNENWGAGEGLCRAEQHLHSPALCWKRTDWAIGPNVATGRASQASSTRRSDPIATTTRRSRWNHGGTIRSMLACATRLWTPTTKPPASNLEAMSTMLSRKLIKRRLLSLRWLSPFLFQHFSPVSCVLHTHLMLHGCICR